MNAHPFAPGAIERHTRPRGALMRTLRPLAIFLTVVALSAFAVGVIAGVTTP